MVNGIGRHSLRDTSGIPGSRPSQGPRREAEVAEKSLEGVLCAACGHTVTDDRQRMHRRGRFAHTFKNPAGIVFRIGCYAAAPGCLVRGLPTEEHTWFTGFLWNFALCGGCRCHLGWFFQSGERDAFYGLILDRLIHREPAG